MIQTTWLGRVILFQFPKIIDFKALPDRDTTGPRKTDPQLYTSGQEMLSSSTYATGPPKMDPLFQATGQEWIQNVTLADHCVPVYRGTVAYVDYKKFICQVKHTEKRLLY